MWKSKNFNKKNCLMPAKKSGQFYLCDAMYALEYRTWWDLYFKKFDKSTQEKIIKKIEKQKEKMKTRHLRQGIEFCVAECSQYRIALKIDEKNKIKTIYFVGNHKQYEKWYLSFIQ